MAAPPYQVPLFTVWPQSAYPYISLNTNARTPPHFPTFLPQSTYLSRLFSVGVQRVQREPLKDCFPAPPLTPFSRIFLHSQVWHSRRMPSPPFFKWPPTYIIFYRISFFFFYDSPLPDQSSLPPLRREKVFIMQLHGFLLRVFSLVFASCGPFLPPPPPTTFCHNPLFLEERKL